MNKFSKLFLGSILALGLASCGEKPTPTPTPEEKVKVTFDYNYETFDEAATSPAAKVVEVVKGEKVAKPDPDPEWSGWRFVQWCTTVAAVMPFDFDSAILADTTIYAKWAEEGSDFDSWAVVGAFGGDDQWNPNSTTYEMATEDGLHYTISNVGMKAGTEFKIIKNHEWTAADINGAKVNAEASTEGCFADAGNVKILLSGVYKLDLDMTNATSPLTITKTGDLDIQLLGYTANVLGDMNPTAWNPQDADVDGNGHLDGDLALTGTWSGMVKIKEGQAFKITLLQHYSDDSVAVAWFGPTQFPALIGDEIGSVGDSDPNFSALSTGEFTFTLTITASIEDLTISYTFVQKEETPEPMVGFFGLVGEYNGWGSSSDVKFTQADAEKRIYTLSVNLMSDEENNEYKVRADEGWNLAFGAKNVTTPLDETVLGGEDNIVCKVAGMYDFYLELDEYNKVVTFTVTAHAAAAQFSISYAFMDAATFEDVAYDDVVDEGSVLPTSVEEGTVNFKIVAKAGYTVVYVGLVQDESFESESAEFSYNVTKDLEFQIMVVYEEPASETVVTFTAGTDKGTQTGQGSYTETLVKEGVTVTAVDSPLGIDTNYRIYQGKSLTISVEGEAKIVSIVLNGNDNNKKVTGFAAVDGLVIDEANNVATFTGSVSTITFTTNVQVRLGSIVVTVA